MNNLAFKFENEYEGGFITDWYDAYASPSKNHGMIATLDLSNIKFNGPKHFWWTHETLGELLSTTQERDKPLTNLYLSLNSFIQVNGVCKRKSTHLAQIRNIGIDLDCYKKNITPEECRDKLFEMILHGKIPNPNIIINSGNGVQIVYSVSNGAAPTSSMQWLASYITAELASALQHLGADMQCTDLARVFRLPNTLNKKKGYPTRLVTADIWNQKEFTLNELMDYVTPYKPVKKRSKLRTVVQFNPNFKKGTRTLNEMNLARANDLVKLTQLRGGHIENRNILCYDYAFAYALATDLSRSDVQRAVSQLDDKFYTQQNKNTLRRTVKSACDNADAFWKAYQDNGFKMPGLPSNLVKPKKASTIIKQHDITAEEMQELDVLFDEAEKLRRKYEKRREKGMKTMDQYNKERAAKVDDVKQRVIDLKATGMKQKDIAIELGISKGRVSQLLKKV